MKTQKSTVLVGIFTVFAVLGLLFAACGNPNGSDNTVPVTGVTLDLSSEILFEGGTLTLTATVEPSNATNKAISWLSSDETVATVANGVVTAVAAGTAIITVTTADGNKTAECTIIVKLVPTSIGITTSPGKTVYKIGEELDLDGLVVIASYEGEDPDENIVIEFLEISGFDNSQTGENELTISYGGETVTFTITVRPFTDISEVSEYLSGKTIQTGTVDDPVFLPIKIGLGNMPQAGSGWLQLLDAIDTAGIFVDLDLSACLMLGTEFDPDFNSSTGKDKIVSITLPDMAESTFSSGSGTEYAFRYFTALRTFSGAGLTSIGGMAFYGSTSLVTVSLPEGLTSIGYGAFWGCTNLALASLPDSLTSLEAYAFYNCRNITLTLLPTGLISPIGDRTFGGCTNLALISLPAGIPSIDRYAFYNCPNLSLTSLPEGLISIGTDAFDRCTALTSISLPASTSIENNPFTGCTSLSLFTLTGTDLLSTIENGKALVQDNIELVSYPSATGEIIMPEEITIIGNYAFNSCRTLTQVILSSGTTIIGDRAFYLCNQLSQITLPDTITYIGIWAFYGCSLTQITLPENINRIEREAFQSCRNLALVTCLAPTPPTLDTNVFTVDWQGDILPNLRIEVPASSVAAYKAAENWSDYADMIFAIE